MRSTVLVRTWQGTSRVRVDTVSIYTTTREYRYSTQFPSAAPLHFTHTMAAGQIRILGRAAPMYSTIYIYIHSTYLLTYLLLTYLLAYLTPCTVCNIPWTLNTRWGLHAHLLPPPPPARISQDKPLYPKRRAPGGGLNTTIWGGPQY